jgi:AcrR family transcriptional regulator
MRYNRRSVSGASVRAVPKAVDHDQRRRELAEAARRVIGRAGLDAATVRAISSEAGYSTGVLTHYFADRDAVLLAALEVSITGAAERRGRVIGADTATAAGLAALRRLMHDELPVDDERRIDVRVWMAFLTQALFSDTLAAAQRRIDHDWRALVHRMLVEAAERRELRAGLDLEMEADRLIAVVDGIGEMALFDRKGWPRARQHEAVDGQLRSLASARGRRVLPPAPGA